jgi:chaperonin cofactor prefoldin
MRRLLNLLLLVLILGGLLVFYVPSLRAVAAQKLSYSVCDQPILYKLGYVDSEFELTETEVLVDIKKAADILNKLEGKELFSYNPNAKLTINFDYDQRTALSFKINQLESNLNSQNKSLEQQINDYKSDTKAFEQKLDELNSSIEQYNQSGGAPPDVYDDLINRQNQLRSAGEALNERARQLKLYTKDYNSQVGSLNQNVDQFNNALSQKPEEGIYDGIKNEITIYFASNKNELIHTLAHEFGHALGMQHVTDQKSIMYPNSTTFLIPTESDKQELTRVCAAKFLPEIWLNQFLIRFKIATQTN